MASLSRTSLSHSVSSAREGRSAGSGTHSLNKAGFGRVDGCDDRRHERSQILDAVGSGANDDDAERQSPDLMLELDAAVHRHEDIIFTPHAAQELAILDPGPAARDICVDRMTGELEGKVQWELLVKQHAHRPRLIGMRGRAMQQPARAGPTGTDVGTRPASPRPPDSRITIELVTRVPRKTGVPLRMSGSRDAISSRRMIAVVPFVPDPVCRTRYDDAVSRGQRPLPIAG